MIVLLATLALAGTAESHDLDHAWARYAARDYEGAAVEGARLLEADPDDLAAHRVFIRSRASTRDRREVEGIYRAWLEAEPDRAAARFGLAEALARSGRDAGPCEEIDALLGELPDDPVTRYWIARLRHDEAKRCGWDAAAVDEELMALAAEHEVAWSYGNVLRLRALDLDEALLVDLRKMYETEPSRMGPAAAALWRDDAKGRLVKQARKDLLAAAQAATASDDPVRVAHAVLVLGRAGADGLQQAEQRLAELDPTLVREGYDPGHPLLREIRDADARPTHALALADLDALADRIPAEGEVRARWQRYRIDRLEALDRPDERYAACRDAARAAPDDGDLQNDFAYEAALRGEDLEEGLAAIDRALEGHRAGRWDPDGWYSYESWARGWRGTLGSWLDTRGWLLFQLGRYEEALVALEEAVRSDPHPGGVLHAHLAAVQKKLGSEEAAFAHLVLAHVDGIDEEALAASARADLEALWPTYGTWHPGGIDGYIASRREPPVKTAPPPSEESHPLLGQDFPIDEVTKVGGGSFALSDIEGIRVVDLWATWCGPCVAGMPHLQEVATAYAERGVTVVGISVDEKQAPVRQFMKGATVAYELGWIGREGFDIAQVDGIPALFVIDGEGKVRRFISGYGDGDTRLERALDALLDEG